MPFEKGHPPYKGIEKGQFKKGCKKLGGFSFVKGNQINKGRKHTDDWKKEMSKRMMGNKPSEQSCQMARERMIKNHPNKGKHPWNYIDGRSKFMGPARYGDDWDKIRYLVYLRDCFTCQDCGVQKQSLDIHHKIPFLESKDNSLDNLVALCKPCHRKEEARIMKTLKNRMEVRLW